MWNKHYSPYTIKKSDIYVRIQEKYGILHHIDSVSVVIEKDGNYYVNKKNGWKAIYPKCNINSITIIEGTKKQYFSLEERKK